MKDYEKMKRRCEVFKEVQLMLDYDLSDAGKCASEYRESYKECQDEYTLNRCEYYELKATVLAALIKELDKMF